MLVSYYKHVGCSTICSDVQMFNNTVPTKTLIICQKSEFAGLSSEEGINNLSALRRRIELSIESSELPGFLEVQI